jgi:hypothetical protein
MAWITYGITKPQEQEIKKEKPVEVKTQKINKNSQIKK